VAIWAGFSIFELNLVDQLDIESAALAGVGSERLNLYGHLIALVLIPHGQ
jgi:hypothetical protein